MYLYSITSLCSRLLVQSFPGNWCAVAQIIMTKSCRQVFEFSKGELGTANVAIKKTPSLVVGTPRDKNNKKKKTKQAALYKGHSQDGERENKHPYTPCYHPGEICETCETCSCRQTGNFCEKFCYCSPECEHRSVTFIELFTRCILCLYLFNGVKISFLRSYSYIVY